MEATATLKYLRMSARKVRLVANLIRGEKLEKAVETLTFLNKKAAKPVSVLLESAAANANQKEGMDTDSLFVSKIVVNEGPTWKRFMPRAMGRASEIQKKTCHVVIFLQDKPESKDADAEIKIEKKEKVAKKEETKTVKKVVKTKKTTKATKATKTTKKTSTKKEEKK